MLGFRQALIGFEAMWQGRPKVIKLRLLALKSNILRTRHNEKHTVTHYSGDTTVVHASIPA